MDVRLQKLFLAAILVADHACDEVRVHVQQCRQRANIHDVLEQLALTRIRVGGVADFRQWHSDDGDVIAELRPRHRLGRVIEQVAPRLELLHIRVPRLRIHGHHEVDAAATPQVTPFRNPDLVPRGQALDVRREDVARADRHAVANDGFRKRLVGRGRA